VINLVVIRTPTTHRERGETNFAFRNLDKEEALRCSRLEWKALMFTIAYFIENSATA
jgi:hypothetical protein